MRLVLSVLAFLGLFLAPAGAAGPSGVPEQVTLSAKLVESFIQSWEPARALAEKHQADWDGKGLSDGEATGLGKLRAYLEGRGALSEFNQLVGSYGFSGFDHWSQVAYSVFVAHGFAQPGASTDAAFAQAIAGIDNNPNLSPQQKAAMKAQMAQSMGSYQAMQPPPANIAAVKPFGARIDALLDD
jgi:hypothetical protein